MEYPRRNGLCYDPVEDTEDYKRVIQDIEKELDTLMADRPGGLGSCHTYWHLKKKLLARAGIDWKSPSECNPHVLFDLR